jgi:hypothetical protein
MLLFSLTAIASLVFTIAAAGETSMASLDERTKANLDVVLDEVWRELPHGGDHDVRKKIAQKLINAARKGNATLSGLSAVARTALADATKKKSAQPAS